MPEAAKGGPGLSRVHSPVGAGGTREKRGRKDSWIANEYARLHSQTALSTLYTALGSRISDVRPRTPI